MKNLFRVLLVVGLFLSIQPVDAMSKHRQPNRRDMNGNRNPHARLQVVQHVNEPVGVPLDGGLLSVLGVSGLVYYLGRRKLNKENKA